MKTAFSAALLMGGRSRRMGVDKASLIDPASGLTSWQRQVQLLDSLCPDERLLSLREGQVKPDGTVGWKTVRDTVDDAGPISGINACLEGTQQPLVLTLGIDLLAMRSETLKILLEKASGAVYKNALGYYEPLAAVYPTEAAASAAEFLASGGRRLQDWIAQGVEAGWMIEIPLPSACERDFLNVNTQETYAKLAES